MIFATSKNCVQKRKEYFALFNILDTQKEITLPQILTILRLHCPSVSNQRSCIKIEKWVFYKSFRPWCYLDLMQSKIKEMTFCFDFAKGILRSITPCMIILFFKLLIIVKYYATVYWPEFISYIDTDSISYNPSIRGVGYF